MYNQTQEERRRQALEEQKKRKCDFFTHARNLALYKLNEEVLTDDEEEEETEEEKKKINNTTTLLTKPTKRRIEIDDENNDKTLNKKARYKGKFKNGSFRRSKRKNPYSNQVTYAEWMYELPKDLEENWYLVLCPVGKRCLVTSAKGNTVSRLRNGNVMDIFESILPAGGSDYKGNKTTDYCILDCVYDQTTFTFYVLDIMCWKGHPIYECDTEFRFYWLTTKFNEIDPPISTSLSTTAAINDSHNSIYKFIPLSPLDCSPRKISLLVSNPDSFGYRCDGLLFFNKQTQYVIGETPLCGWIGIEKVKEILGNYLSCDQQTKLEDGNGEGERSMSF